MDHNYSIKFTEEEYWAMYHRQYKKHNNVFNHKSTLPFLIAALFSAGLLTVLLIGFDRDDEREYAYPIASLIICLFAFVITFIFKAYAFHKATEKIKKHYQSVKNGIDIIFNNTNIVFHTESQTWIMFYKECKEAVLEDNFIQINFTDGNFQLIPRGKESVIAVKQLEDELINISGRLNTNTFENK